MIQKNDLYDYGLYIYQNTDYFKFSLDSILLAEFVELKDNLKILDICSGNIPVPLILYKKNNTVKIDAVEIQEEIVKLANKTLEENGLKENINIINTDINIYEPNYKYDIITCNPPYFKLTNSKVINLNDIKGIARHEINFKLNDLINIVKNNLKDDGCFYMVHRAERLIEIINIFNEARLGIRKIAFIKNNDEQIEMILIKGCKNKKNDPKIYVKEISNLKSYKNIFE